jgi:hypothetical protein
MIHLVIRGTVGEVGPDISHYTRGDLQWTGISIGITVFPPENAIYTEITS